MRKIIFLLIIYLSIFNNVYALNLSRVKTWSSSEVLTAADLNAEFDNIINRSIVNADVASGAAIVGSKLDLTSPGAIGSTSANTGAFTTLSATSNVTFDTSTLFLNATSNKVGIGTTSPSNFLSVAGGVGIGTTSPSSTFHSTKTVSDGGLIVEGNVGINTTNPLALLQVGTSPGPGLLVTASGNVGINSTSPTTLLRIGKAGTWTFDAGQTVSGTWADLGTVTTCNIDGGTIDGVTIGGASAGAITCTTLATGGKLTAGANEIEGSNFDIDGGTIDGATLGGASAVNITSATATSITGLTTLTAGGDLDIGSYELRAQTLESDVGTGTAPMTIASTTKVTNLNADLLDGYNTATAASAATQIYVSGSDGYLPDATVDTTALKTASSEITHNSSGSWNYATVTGGQYCFWPQIKDSVGTGTGQAMVIKEMGQGTTTTSYTTKASLLASGSDTFYANFLYITASGQDLWLWLLIDKNTKEIISASAASDHPAYGNGGDFEKTPHPFANYDPNTQEIVLVDNDTIIELKSQVTTEKSLLTIVNEEYKVNKDKEEVYKPLHSGKFLDQQPELVQNIPDYIKVRKLTKLNDEEKQQKIQKQELMRQKVEQDKAKKEQDKIKALDKLNKLGFTDNEIEVLLK